MTNKSISIELNPDEVPAQALAKWQRKQAYEQAKAQRKAERKEEKAKKAEAKQAARAERDEQLMGMIVRGNALADKASDENVEKTR